MNLLFLGSYSSESKPTSLPPIYEPEVGARMVVHAALVDFPRREYWVGGSTVKAILGQKVVPGLLDKYLGKNGYESQQRGIEDPPDRSHNLWQPVTSEFGGHGPFDKQSRPFSLEANVSRHPALLALGFRLVGVAICVKKIMYGFLSKIPLAITSSSDYLQLSRH